jgi:hypothetical protein
MTETAIPEDIREKAKAVRDQLCIDCECAFDEGCGCLDALQKSLLAERREQKERDADVAAGCWTTEAHWDCCGIVAAAIRNQP